MKFVSFQFCNCKNTCGRRSGRKNRGCPCRDEGLKCADDCTCGTKKAACNNKQETVAVSVAGTSAFERHQIAVDEAKGHITVGVFFGSFDLPVLWFVSQFCIVVKVLVESLISRLLLYLPFLVIWYQVLFSISLTSIAVFYKHR